MASEEQNIGRIRKHHLVKALGSDDYEPIRVTCYFKMFRYMLTLPGVRDKVIARGPENKRLIEVVIPDSLHLTVLNGKSEDAGKLTVTRVDITNALNCDMLLHCIPYDPERKIVPPQSDTSPDGSSSSGSSELKRNRDDPDSSSSSNKRIRYDTKYLRINHLRPELHKEAFESDKELEIKATQFEDVLERYEEQLDSLSEPIRMEMDRRMEICQLELENERDVRQKYFDDQNERLNNGLKAQVNMAELDKKDQDEAMANLLDLINRGQATVVTLSNNKFLKKKLVEAAKVAEKYASMNVDD